MMEPEICRKCGTPRVTRGRYCHTCGTKYPKDVEYVRLGTSTSPGAEGSAPPPPPSDPSEAPPRLRWGRLAVAGALVVGLIAAGVVFFLPSGGTPAAYALQFSKAKAGDTYRYRMEMDMDALVGSPDLGFEQPVRTSVEVVLSMRVVSVDGDGVATVDLTMERGKATVNDVTETVPGATVRVRISPDGRLVSVGGEGVTGTVSAGVDVPGLDQLTPLLPDHKVTPGDTWSKSVDVPFPFGDGDIHLAVTGKFLEYETVEGARVSVIRTEAIVPIDVSMNLREMAEALDLPSADLPSGADPEVAMGGNVRMVQVSRVDLTTGRWYRTKSNGTFDMVFHMSGLPAGQGPTEGTIRFAGTMKLLVEDLS